MPTDESPQPRSLFEPVDSRVWLPTDYARGPWSPDALHGGPVAALLASAAEQAGDEDGGDWHPARLSVELVRPVPLEPLAVRAELTRPGRKVQLIDAEVRTADATVVAIGRLLRIRAKDIASAPVTTAGLEPPPRPDTLVRSQPMAGDLPAFHSHGVEHRFASGMFGVPGPATDWIRLTVPVLPGQTPTPLQRVAAAADFGNGISGVVSSFEMLLYINPDLTIHLHRAPVGEWVCLEAQTWMEDHGMALAESRLWDEHGPIGRSLQSLLVDDRAPGGAQ